MKAPISIIEHLTINNLTLRYSPMSREMKQKMGVVIR